MGLGMDKHIARHYKVWKILFILLLSAGFFFLGKGLWIPCKAVLAQSLLHRAWHKSFVSDQLVRPWPWADTWPVARIIVPSEGIDQIILEGDSGQALAFGPGHVPGSPLPQSPGNAILVGHRDTSFSFLKNINKGDALFIEAKNGKKYAYSVQKTFVMDADDIYFDNIDERWLTLITCYPFHSISSSTGQRYVVLAKGNDDA